MTSSTNSAVQMIALKHLKTILSLVFALMIGVAEAQTPDLDIDTRSAGSVMVCGESLLFTVIITNTSGSAVENVRLYPQMPAGMVYVAGSAQAMAEVAPLDPLDPSFLVGNLPDGNPKTVYFQARANCGLIETLREEGATSNVVNNDTKIKYVLGGVEKDILEPNGSESYSVLFPELELFIPEHEKNQGAPFINKVMNRHIAVKNSGLGKLSGLDFYLKPDAELAIDKLEVVTASGNHVITHSIIHPVLGRKYTVTDFSGAGNGDAFLDEGEEVQLIDYVKAITSKGAIETIYTAQWGCLNVVCNPDDSQAQFSAYVEAIGGKPSQSVVGTQAPGRTDFCNDPAILRWSFINEGSGNSPASKDAAFNIEFLATQHAGLTTDNHKFYINHANGALVPISSLLVFSETTVNNPGQPTDYYRRSSFKFKDVFTSDPDGEGGLADVDGDGFFDDMPVGSTLSFTGELLSSLATQSEYDFDYIISTGIFYQEWSGQGNGYGSYIQGVKFEMLSQEMTGASDLTNGRRETVRFELKENNSSSILKTQDAIFHINLQVPQGVKLRSARWSNRNLTYSQTGNTITIVDPLGLTPNYTNLDFEFELVCSEAAPGILSDNITLDMLYYFDKNCPAFFKVATATKEMYLHCGTCSTVETTLFKAERKTLGWIPPSSSNFYRYKDLFGSSPVSKVTRETPGIRLDAAYPKDEIEVTVQGRVADITTTNLAAEIKYTAPIQEEMLHVVSATFVPGNGQNFNLPPSALERTSQGLTYKYTFNIPLGTGGIPAQLAPGDVFELKVRYKVDVLDGVEQGEYPLSDFRGQFYTHINGVPTNCLGFGDDFLILRPKAVEQPVTFSHTEKDKVAISLFWFEGGNDNVKNGIQDFPNEFRPVFYNGTQTITLPKGYIFDRTRPVEFSIGPPGTTNVFTHTGAQFSPDNRTVTIPRNGDTPLAIRPGIYFLASVVVDCGNPDNLFVPVTTNVDKRGPLTNNQTTISFAYLSNTSDHESFAATGRSTDIYNYRRPGLRLTANSIQEGYSETVTWPIQLCNISSVDRRKALNTWIAFELKSNDQSTVLQKVLDENGNVLTDISRYGPGGKHLLVRLGTVELTSCLTLKVVAAYTNCQEDSLQNIDVYTSWDYHNYPGVSGYTGSILDRKASCEGYVLSEVMTIKYKTADLQWEVRKNGPEEVDLCVATPFEIDLASTRYGDMRQLKVWMQLPPLVTFDPASPPQYRYPFNAAPAPIPADAWLNQDGKTGIDITKLTGGNLPGIHSNDNNHSDDNKIRLAFSLTTSCGFDPGLPIKYTVNGYTNCGDYIEYTDQRRIRLNGISSSDLDSLVLTLAAPQALTCNSDNDISLSIKNAGDAASGLNQLEVVLPPGTAFREMITPGDLPAPLAVTENNQVKLRWILPAGYLDAGASKSFIIRTFLNQTPAGTTSVMFTARTYVTADGHCAETTEPCNTPVTFAQSELSVPVTGLTSLSIAHQRYICTYQFTASSAQVGDCMITGYSWSFGDGGTSTEAMPFHSFGASDTYAVSVRVNFNCGGCSGAQSEQMQLVVGPEDAIWKDTTIQVPAYIKKQVLHVSAATFSDSWPTQHINPALDEKHSFRNGTLGVWRNDGAFVYETARQAGQDKVNVRADGTFDLNHFNWQYADLGAIPGWVKANTMTQYSPFSYELENRDVLGIYSAALYDYGGHLPSANGVNMRNAEMAFTGFEFLEGKSSGNWIFGTGPVPGYYLYPISSAEGNIAVVEASLKDLDDVVQVDVSAHGFFNVQLPSRFNYTQHNKIECKLSYGPNPDWSVVVLKEAPHGGLWKGRMKVTNQILPVTGPDIDNTIAHSGKSSLKVSAERTFRQNLLQLDSGKRYVVSAWVTVSNPSLVKPMLAEELGIDMVIRNKQGQVRSTYSVVPSGPVVEGWQQVKGTFTYTGAKNSTLELKFRPGTTGTAWYDDLRLHPEQGNMKSYVYDLRDYRLRAILDEENFASFYFYDAEGNLYLVKKETEDGIKTISENVSNLSHTGSSH